MTIATTQTTTKTLTFTNNPMGNNPFCETGGIGRKYDDKVFSFGAVDTTTKKARLFINEPMGNKPLTAVGGIGPYYARSLTLQGFTNAAQLYVHFLDMKRDREQFKNWFFQVTGAEAKWQDQCYDSLNGYYQNFHQ